jgi:hypothetical protein
LAKAAAIAAVAGGAMAVLASISIAQVVVGSHGSCGTGRGEEALALLIVPPVLCTLPALAWQAAGPYKVALLVCRCSLWGGLAAWMTACAFMFR